MIYPVEMPIERWWSWRKSGAVSVLGILFVLASGFRLVSDNVGTAMSFVAAVLFLFMAWADRKLTKVERQVRHSPADEQGL